MKPAISRWDDRFAATDEYLFGKNPNAFLVKHATPLIKSGMTVLAIADGEGRNGIWLAEQGCKVWSIDSAPAASAKAKRLALERGVELHIETADIAQWPWHTQQFDMVVGIFFQFANPELRSDIFNGMAAAVKPGGHLLIEGYGLKQLEYKTGGPDIPEHLYTLELMRSSFANMRIDVLEECDAELEEGDRHKGTSALVDLVAFKVEQRTKDIAAKPLPLFTRR